MSFSAEFWVGTFIAIVLFLIAVGASLATSIKTRGEFRVAVGCFLGSALIATWGVLVWQENTRITKWPRVIIAYALIALIVLGTGEIIRWSHGRHLSAKSELPPKVPPSTPPEKVVSPPQPTSPKGSEGKSGVGAKQSQQNRGPHNTDTQIGTAQAPVAIAPNGIANAAPNFGNQSVNNYAPLQRSLNQDQRNTFIAVLRKACPFEVAVRAVPGNPESMSFGDELAKAITDAGCTLRRPRFLIDTSAGYGVWVMLHDKENIPAGADALVDALAQAGLTPKTNTLDAIEPGVVYLMVGFNDAK